MKALNAEARPFAFLRLAHEALRVASQEVIDLAAAGDDRLPAQLNALIEGIEIHAEQEDGGLYPVMDAAFDEVASKEGYHDEHVTLHEGNAAVRAAVLNGDADALDKIKQWAQFNEDHLLHEEKVLQPLVSTLTEDLPKACVTVQGIIDTVDRERTETWQVGWVASKLHAGRPFGKLSKYVQALQHISDDAQFERMKKTLRANLPDDAWTKLEAAGVLDAGRL